MKIRPSASEVLRRARISDSNVAERQAADGNEPGTSSAVTEVESEQAAIVDAAIGEAASQLGRAEDALVTEAALVEIARSDPHAFAGLYERHVDRIYAYVYHRVGNVHDAEDLTARTFYRALDRLDQYEDRGLPFSAWLFRIAHNLVANWHRDRQRRRFLSLDRLWWHSHDGDSPERQVESEARQAALRSAMERLSEDRRNLLLLKFGGQMTNVEIGELLNKSESAVKSLYFRTLAALRKDLESRGWGDEDVTSPADAETEEGADSEAESNGAGR